MCYNRQKTKGGVLIDKNEQLILKLATLAGTLLIQSEAEGYRVERTVNQILSLSNFDQPAVFSSASGLFLTLQDSQLKKESPMGSTIIVRVKNRKNHIRIIHQVNDIVYKLLDEAISPQEAYLQLNQIHDQEYTTHNQFVWTILLIMSFVILLEGGLGDVVIALIPTIMILFFKLSEDDFGLNRFAVNVLMTSSLAFVLPIIHLYVTNRFNLNIVIGATLMPLYPGTAFTNGIRDLLRGDYSTGITRLVDAFKEGLSLALGVGIGLAISYGVINLWN
ncbi:threonine/serine exporter ThrE family protein [Facklamia sp. 7083-14-GEN3]|uniref:threonine/serine ThrE exporter family protein n=1 Tax=Facklamia sp. 7083-14-GEN3 TaxID=2973478 RepID=UPI00215C7462|nr:threonine/serine exporter family protein [Facklamia sp. 7083-14-GEN3]MCR8968548.1 threonine/serine exporter family protein [Facklamia sp. 7083-14-GEN3]